MQSITRARFNRYARIAGAVIALAAATGCAKDEIRAHPSSHTTARVVVVAPVVNLSGSSDFDVLKVTDTLASEFCAFPGVAVVPVNLTLAALSRRGRMYVESSDDALYLLREFHADATVVVGIHEYSPYQPPVIGMVMQWYDSGESSVARLVDSDAPKLRGPARQLQRVFDAAHDDVLVDVRRYAAQRDFSARPLGWRTVTLSQEMYLRYCCWAMIRTILIPDGFPDDRNGPK